MKKQIKIKYKIIVFIIIAIIQACFINTIISFSEATVKGTKTLEDGIYVIRSAIDNKFVLDVNGASKDDGANVQLYEYSNDNQKKFKVSYLGDGYYSIIAMHSNKSLDVKYAGQEVGTNVWQYEWTNTEPQKWVIKDVGNGYYNIIAKCNGLYVDVHNAIAANHTNIQMCNSNGMTAQKFKFEKVAGSSGNSNSGTTGTPNKPIVTGTKTIEDGTYVIRSAINNNFVLDVNGASKEDGANVQLYEYSNDPQKKFKVSYLGDGYYSIIATHSNKSLDVKYGETAVGTNVWQYEWTNTEPQKWVIKDAGNGNYNIIAKCNGLYVDVHNAVAANHTNIQMCNSNGMTAQKFKFEKVAESNTNTPGDSNGGTTVVPPSKPTVTGTKTIEDGTYVIRSAIDNKYVLNVDGASKDNEANVELYEYANVEQRKFKVTYLGDGYYSLIAKHSNKSLDVKYAGTTVGTNVWQYDWNNSDPQKWVIKDAGNGYYSIISKCNGLYVDVHNAVATNHTNIQMCDGNGLNAQKFKFEKATENNNNTTGGKTIADGIYVISSALNPKFVLDVEGASIYNGANVQLYEYSAVAQKRFKVTYLGNGYYSLIAQHSNKSLDVKYAETAVGTNVWQWEANGSDPQQWLIKEAGDGYYNIISKCNGLYLDVHNASVRNGTNIQMCNSNGMAAQKFKFESLTIDIDTARYPGYKERIEALINQHPSWNFELLYTGLKFGNVTSGECKLHSRNLVPTNYGGEWVCSVCGTKLYDSGWYCASEKAVAYYMDPRNFLDETNVFQFQDLNQYKEGVCTLAGIQSKVNGTFLQNYATAIDNACRNQNVNSYYIIARLLQEQGTKGTTIGTGMNGGDGKTYYNPFNIGASGNGYEVIYAGALRTAKANGWDSMQKGIEGGITVCKKNWLENYQNTLYQNKFDIDTRNGTSLYTHQYMQNLMAAYSEARTMRSMYVNTNTLDTNMTFIIPVYEEMGTALAPQPGNNQETGIMNVQVTANGGLYLRQDASTSSATIRLVPQGEVVLSLQRGINSNWQKVILTDGTIGYMSGTYLRQVNDVTNCNYTARVRTSDGSGCNARLGPSTRLGILTALSEGTTVRVINDITYKNIDGYDWSRVQLPDGRQAFMPSRFLAR